MGTGDTSEVPGDAWGSGHTTSGDDGWESGRELDTGGLSRMSGQNRVGTGSVSLTTQEFSMGRNGNRMRYSPG
jgi:hypothetical protein